jgi:hypothetical protein
VESGKLKFESLDAQDATNAKLVSELNVPGTSLYLVVTGDGRKFYKQINDVWLYWDKPEQAKEIIRNELSKYL